MTPSPAARVIGASKLTWEDWGIGRGAARCPVLIFGVRAMLLINITQVIWQNNLWDDFFTRGAPALSAGILQSSLCKVLHFPHRLAVSGACKTRTPHSLDACHRAGQKPSTSPTESIVPPRPRSQICYPSVRACNTIGNSTLKLNYWATLRYRIGQHKISPTRSALALSVMTGP